ncbi:MAG: FtsW/RodA/SpoVE family cell cycle protein [Pseudomonadota bacterium]
MNRSIWLLPQWWQDVDRVLLASVLGLMAFGVIVIFSTGPSHADRIGLPENYMIIRHALYVGCAVAITVFVSMWRESRAGIISFFIYLLGLIGVVATLLYGQIIKGASRWLYTPLGSIQPSEFVKIGFVVTVAALLAYGHDRNSYKGFWMSFVLLVITTGLFLLQPDIGMSLIIVSAWLAQVFVVGIAWWWLALIICFAGGFAFYCYLTFDHVQLRIDRFLGLSGDSVGYQVERSLTAMASGEWWGVGAGAGTIKRHLPDSHADFVFAVVVEEFGAVIGLVLLMVILLIALRALAGTRHCDMRASLACTGLVCLTMMQAVANVGSAIGLLPPKGSTLPFISYGGSSLWANALAWGLILAFLRSRSDHGFRRRWRSV